MTQIVDAHGRSSSEPADPRPPSPGYAKVGGNNVGSYDPDPSIITRGNGFRG
ncbi:hypothetical protein ACEZDB_37680 [Streptacidiphilus sp. N1-3]|uniref:Uncharacterized protein n=1 Tax=Streptacidiphilus alkalitolerans TaxID=3342712 RepID=A0ABV6XDT3_9ACTN